jgi:hypothetical protein
MARYTGIYPGKWQTDHKKDWMAEKARVEKLMDDLYAKMPILRNKSMVGAILKFGVADGYAVYIVTNDEPLEVQHIPIGDAWHIDRCHMNGIDMEEVRRQVREHWGWQKLMKARKKKRGR